MSDRYIFHYETIFDQEYISSTKGDDFKNLKEVFMELNSLQSQLESKAKELEAEKAKSKGYEDVIINALDGEK